MFKKLLFISSSILFAAIFSSPVLAVNVQVNNASSHTNVFTGHKDHNPLTGTTSVSSSNWSGYAVTGSNGSFSSVSSSWVQPSVNCSAVSSNSYSSYWVGLDGFSSSTVEQIGTEADCINSAPSYVAWYEMYPSNPYEIQLRFNVNPGDEISARVNYIPSTTVTTVKHNRTIVTSVPASYKLSISNQTTGQSFSTSITPKQTFSRSSAEVITEAPYSNGILPLADFNQANYNTSLVNGSPMGGMSNLQSIIMDNPAGMIATPTNFDSTNENFSVNWSSH